MLRNNIIKIHVSGVGHSFIKFNDEDDACMKKIISSFDIVDATNGPQFGIHNSNNIKRAIFHLSDLNEFEVDIRTRWDLSEHDFNIKHLLVKCAMESIIKKFYAESFVKKDAITFQSSNYPSSDCSDSKKLRISRMHVITNPNKNLSEDEAKICLYKDTISHTGASLEKNTLHIVFNQLTLEEENKMKSVLKGLFKETHEVSLKNTIGYPKN